MGYGLGLGPAQYLNAQGLRVIVKLGFHGLNAPYLSATAQRLTLALLVIGHDGVTGNVVDIGMA
jgi:hypothetical protein